MDKDLARAITKIQNAFSLGRAVELTPKEVRVVLAALQDAIAPKPSDE